VRRRRESAARALCAQETRQAYGRRGAGVTGRVRCKSAVCEAGRNALRGWRLCPRMASGSGGKRMKYRERVSIAVNEIRQAAAAVSLSLQAQAQAAREWQA